jgi:hypothetical protein
MRRQGADRHSPRSRPREDEERQLVAELRKARVSAFCVGPLLMLAGPILGLVLLTPFAGRSWTSTGTVLTLLVCAAWTGCGLVMVLWAWRWTPEAWARLVLGRGERKRRGRDAAG